MFILLVSPLWQQATRQQDYEFLYDHGATAIFGPGTNIPKCCIQLLQILVDRAKAEAKEG